MPSPPHLALSSREEKGHRAGGRGRGAAGGRDPPVQEASRPSGAAVPPAHVCHKIGCVQAAHVLQRTAGHRGDLAKAPEAPLHASSRTSHPPDRCAATSAIWSPEPPESAPRSITPSSPAPGRARPALTGLGRVAVHGIGRDVHLLHARVLPARQGPHGRWPAPPSAAHRGRSPRNRRGGLLPAAARLASALRLWRRGAPGAPRTILRRAPRRRLWRGCGLGRGRRRRSGRVMSAAARARGPRRPRPMAGRGGSERAAPANGRRDAAGAAAGPGAGSRAGARGRGGDGRGSQGPGTRRAWTAHPAQITAREPPPPRPASSLTIVPNIRARHQLPGLEEAFSSPTSRLVPKPMARNPAEGPRAARQPQPFRWLSEQKTRRR